MADEVWRVGMVPRHGTPQLTAWRQLDQIDGDGLAAPATGGGGLRDRHRRLRPPAPLLSWLGLGLGLLLGLIGCSSGGGHLDVGEVRVGAGLL